MSVIENFVQGSIYPNFNWQIISEECKHLSPMRDGELITLHCPNCFNAASHYLFTGVIECKQCGHIDLLYAIAKHKNIKRSLFVRFIANSLKLEIKDDVKREIRKSCPPLIDTLQKRYQVPADYGYLINLGYTEAELVKSKTLVLLPDTQSVIDDLVSISGYIPSTVRNKLQMMPNDKPTLALNSYGKLKLASPEFIDGVTRPFYLAKSAKVFLTDDPYFAQLCWLNKKRAYLFDPNRSLNFFMTNVMSKLKYTQLVGIWRTIDDDHEVIRVTPHETEHWVFDWHREMVNGTYKTLKEKFL
ncbi:hypothetical protein [uncultured Photobacterium sp.]|uniref:hypothetical protein n=1 Tax=uncultured Photobacterium sp. TaxID=173973 RepID=UPI00260BCACC|nr:hypothetical protein [uncultured Photobacterium sp.]